MKNENNAGNGATQARRKPRPRTAELERDLAARMGRAEGQLRGVRKMIEEGAYCIDILQQVSAARRAVDKAALMLVRDHLETCVTDAIAARDAAAKIDELVEALDRFLA
ncbi:MAG: metal-sensitive transcriptional regulator [Candidatus Binataceae bacterium]